jgi:galactose-1-phosphate uridylyltransferase
VRKKAMGELRRDPVVNRWVIIDSERAEREALFQMELCAPIPASECPFCPGREAEHDEIFALGRPGRAANEPGWWLRVIPDKYPILSREGTSEIDEMGGKISPHSADVPSASRLHVLGDRKEGESAPPGNTPPPFPG